MSVRVKVTDFGIARPASSAAVPGTDGYALGAVGYECLAGRRAFGGENPVQVPLKQIREEPAGETTTMTTEPPIDGVIPPR